MVYSDRDFSGPLVYKKGGGTRGFKKEPNEPCLVKQVQRGGSQREGFGRGPFQEHRKERVCLGWKKKGETCAREGVLRGGDVVQVHRGRKNEKN